MIFSLFKQLPLLLLAIALTTFNLKASSGSTGQAAGFQATAPVNEEEGSLLTRYEVKPGSANKIRKLITKYIKRANRRNTNIMAEAYYEQENPSILWVIERWNSKAELDKNKKRKKSRLVERLSAKELVRLPAFIYIKDLEPLSKKQWRIKPAPGDQPVTIMLFVDSKPGTATTFETIYHAAMPQFRGEPGVINYQLSQLQSDSNQFVTYEKFRNEEAFQFHLQFPPIQPVLDYLNTSIKKQPFQSGLHRLVLFAPGKPE